MLDSRRLGLAGGIVGGLLVFLFTLVSLYTGFGTMSLTMISDLYVGYTITWSGAFIGGMYGFIQAFLYFYVLAAIYNRLGKRHSH